MSRHRTLPVLALVFSGGLGGCIATDGEKQTEAMTPTELLEDPGGQNGKPVLVHGWLDFGFEQRHLFQFNEKTIPPVDKQSCVSIEVDSSVRPSAEKLNGSHVWIEGVFFADLAADRIFLGLCNEAGIKVRSIAPAPP